MPEIWRLIPPFQAPGWVHMALDDWLLERHRLGHHPPTLRFYTWFPPALSLGYLQKRWSPSWRTLTWQGIPLDLVRRPTGGRAVLHQGDLTYAVITSGCQGNRIQVYQQLCEFLIRGWRSLGVSLHYGQGGRTYAQSPNCFGTATGADLVLPNGVKLIGSAQLYRGGAVLHHGSMRLGTDRGLYHQVFGTELPPLPDHPPFTDPDLAERAMESLTIAATQWFGVELVPQPLSPLEWRAILAQTPLPVTGDLKE